jgi:hypothetical protein
VARYDFSLSDHEIGRLTLFQFDLLWQRREMAFKRNCYLQGIVAASVYNSRRTEWRQEIFTPFNFVPRAATDCQHDEIVMTLRGELSGLTPEQIPLARAKWFETLTKQNVPKVEEILLEVFSGLGG